MPAGSAPGERRGGRQKGTPNAAKAQQRDSIAEALKIAFAELGNEAIDELSPAQMLRFSARAAAKAGFIQAACALAKDAAPYFDRRAPEDPGGAETALVIKGGLPDE